MSGTSGRAFGDSALYGALREFDQDWVELAAAAGFTVVREPGAYVSYDGAGVVSVAPYDDLDPDDCLAQIVLHELCHYLVEGPTSADAPDWALDNETERDAPKERAALRVQAVVLERFGLREVLAPTTDFRASYDAFSHRPLDGPPDEVEAAQLGLSRWEGWKWARHAEGLLERLAQFVASFRETHP